MAVESEESLRKMETFQHPEGRGQQTSVNLRSADLHKFQGSSETLSQNTKPKQQQYTTKKRERTQIAAHSIPDLVIHVKIQIHLTARCKGKERADRRGKQATVHSTLQVWT